MKARRGQFSSRMGFVFAASGSAVGLGNVWGFPTNTASNGGAAFVLVYLLLAFCLAYPALMAELIIGRHANANICTALRSLSVRPITRFFATITGGYGVFIASLILSFYSIVAGWMLAHLISALCTIMGVNQVTTWFSQSSYTRDIACTLVFSIMTIAVVARGVANGIERWSTRLMPALILLMITLIVYVLFQPGALTGLSVYLIPDFTRIFHPSLIVSALGQAFFSLSLGVGTMLIYGSYIRKEDNLPVIGATVTLVDVGIAFLAGMLIMPALFVAQELGIDIYRGESLIAGPDLIFTVLPTLFQSMGFVGTVTSMAFFALMIIAALTSSISMLEGPVALVTETTPLERTGAAWGVGIGVSLVSILIIWNFELLFGAIVSFTTEYSQPLLGILLCFFAGWIMNRKALLEELVAGDPQVENTLFWKIWPVYVKVFCPLLIALAFIQNLR